MIGPRSVLIKLVALVDRLPLPPPPIRGGRGRPRFYPDRLFLKAVVIMIVRHLHTVHELLSVLDEPTEEMHRLRSHLVAQGRYPSRRTWERRLADLPTTLPAQIGCLGRYLVGLIQPFALCGRAAAIDSTVLSARGGVWHKKDRAQGRVPDTRIDTEAHWTQSGWHGWVYGWKLHLVTTVAAVWLPLAARLTPANRADNEEARPLIEELPEEIHYLLGDIHYNAPNVRDAWEREDRFLVVPQYGPYPHDDDGKEVRRVFHKLRSLAMENFNEQFKSLFDGHGPVPTKGERKTQRFVLGAVLVYQLIVWYRFEHGLDLRSGLKAFLKAA
jgi:hypothetical protein